MNDNLVISKTSVIALLVITAVILSCAWALISEQTAPSSPVGATARGGYYIITTTASPMNGPDQLWIANVETQQLMLFDTQADGTITPLAAADLEIAFSPRTMRNFGNAPIPVPGGVPVR